jgi:hypothetical protein
MKYFLGKTIGFVNGVIATYLVSFSLLGVLSLKAAVDDAETPEVVKETKKVAKKTKKILN